MRIKYEVFDLKKNQKRKLKQSEPRYKGKKKFKN